MIIMCDIDGVLNDLIEKTLSIYNLENNKNIQMSDLDRYSFCDCLSEEDANGIINLFKRKDLWEYLSPMPDAQWGLKTLIDDGHEVYLATATHHENFSWKVNWIAKHYPFIDIHNIICIHNKGLLKCDVMIDDCIDNLIRSTCKRIVIDHPWNQDEVQEYNIHRAYNFVDVVDIIKSMERND